MVQGPCLSLLMHSTDTTNPFSEVFALVIDWTDFSNRVLMKGMKGIIAPTSNGVAYIYLLNKGPSVSLGVMTAGPK